MENSAKMSYEYAIVQELIDAIDAIESAENVPHRHDSLNCAESSLVTVFFHLHFMTQSSTNALHCNDYRLFFFLLLIGHRYD